MLLLFLCCLLLSLAALHGYELSPLATSCELPSAGAVYFSYYLRRPDGTRLSQRKINPASVSLAELSPFLQDILSGLCAKNSRDASFSAGETLDLSPVVPAYKVAEDSIFNLELFAVTSEADLAVTQAIAENRLTDAYSLLGQGHGINAVDASGSSTLMAAISLGNLEIFSAVLNSRHARVDYNYHKPTGHNAVFYSLLESRPNMLKFLLSKGADPNKYILDFDGEETTTALHFAVENELFDHAELLLKHGANPFLVDKNEKYAEDLIPEFSLSSKKRKLKALFAEKNAEWMKKLEAEEPEL